MVSCDDDDDDGDDDKHLDSSLEIIEGVVPIEYLARDDTTSAQA